mgnify:CR=1 FL=1
MKRYLFFTLFLCFLFLMNWIVKAQDKTETENLDFKEVENVENIISTFYESISGAQGEKRDWNKFQSLFLSNARLIPSGKTDSDGQFKIHPITVNDFINSSTQWFQDNGFYHTEIFRKIETFSHLTHVMSTFESRRVPEEDPFNRGIYSFQLFHDEERWWIVNIYWATESANQPIPSEYLPASN